MISKSSHSGKNIRIYYRIKHVIEKQWVPREQKHIQSIGKLSLRFYYHDKVNMMRG